jgi:hypothetical protein
MIEQTLSVRRPHGVSYNFDRGVRQFSSDQPHRRIDIPRLRWLMDARLKIFRRASLSISMQPQSIQATPGGTEHLQNQINASSVKNAAFRLERCEGLA